MRTLTNHAFWVAIAAYWVFSAGISALPEPTTSSTPFYTWLYRFLHTIAGNIDRVVASKVPLAVVGQRVDQVTVTQTTAAGDTPVKQ